MTYRLLALDLDGTLLQRDGSVHPRDAQAVARLLDRGVTVTLCTGRMYSGTRHVAAQLGLEGPLGCVDGSQVMWHGAEGSHPLDEATLKGDAALHLRSILHRRQAARFFAAGDRIVHDALGAPFTPYVGTWTGALEETRDLHGHALWEDAAGVLAAIVVGALADIEASAAEVRAELDDHAHLLSFPLSRFDGLGGMVVRAKGRTKGTALQAIGAHHGISPREMVAVGDWLNDAPMFEVAGRSFVMPGAPESLRALATDAVETPLAQGGVAEAIERAFG